LGGETSCSVTRRESRQVAPDRGSCCGGPRCARTALRYSLRGRVDKLAAFAAGTKLKQCRRDGLRSALRAPTSKLRSSPPQKSPLPGATCRDHNQRWRSGGGGSIDGGVWRITGRLCAAGGSQCASDRVACDRWRTAFSLVEPPRWFRKGVFGPGVALRGRRRGAQGAWPRAQRASSSDSPRLFEQSERSERSEFRGGPRDRAPERSRRASGDRRGEAPRPARTRLCRSDAAVRTRLCRSGATRAKGGIARLCRRGAQARNAQEQTRC
jgi:hypothetical protein